MILAILALGFLIVVHEGGHYFVARWCKMRVERFSIGFGPGILKRKTKSGTIFQLAPIPFGGFVEIRGMNIAEEVDPEDVAAYPNRPAWQRFLTILAGPATNYVSAIFLAFGLYTCHGQPVRTYYVAEITDGYDAKGKIEPGDRIIGVDGVTMSASTLDLQKVINAKHGAPVTVTVRRPAVADTLMARVFGGKDLTFSIQPKIAKDKDGKEIRDKDGNQLFIMGVQQRLVPDIVSVGILEASGDAITFPIEQTKLILGNVRDIFSGKEKADPGGPVRIVGEFKAAFSRGLPDGIKLLMLLSVYLGLFNLFPLPALDGGRLVFLTYEMVTRRRANPKIETMVHMGGIMVLMIVMVLVTLHDFSVF
ncbi:MAG: rane-associated zinc metalloprotease [Deltaproteobacteria bacterium]|nr:rane-associated zinc metalloprotease [Deltaproteobacteria bacterium]